MDSVKIYKLAESMTDAEYEKKYSKLTEKQKLSVQSLIRLGDTPKLALATTLLNKDSSENSDTWNLYKYAKGSTIEKVIFASDKIKDEHDLRKLGYNVSRVNLDLNSAVKVWSWAKDDKSGYDWVSGGYTKVPKMFKDKKGKYILAYKYIGKGEAGSRYANGGNMEGWGGTSESSQDGMLIGGTNAELTSNQYGNGGGVKHKTEEEIYEEEQHNAMFNSEYAKGGVIPYALRKRVENVKKKFGIEITKEMGLQAYHWNTEEGMGGSSVGLKLYKAKNKRDSQTIGDTAIDLGKYYSEYGNGGMTSGWCYSIGGL